MTDANIKSIIDSVLYTTICIDIYGRVYDLSYEHPSWEQKKKAGGKENIYDKCIVRTAFMCPVSDINKYRKKKK